MSTFEEVSEIVLKLSAVFPEWRPLDMQETLAGYYETLQKYPFPLLQKAAARCKETCDFFPRVSQLREAADDIHSAYEKATYNAQKLEDKKPLSPEIRKYLDEFRERMVKERKWRPTPRKRDRWGIMVSQ